LYRHAASKYWDDGCLARLANGTLKSGGGGVVVVVSQDTCDCCAASEAVSNFYNTCPTTSPAAVPYWNQTIGDSLSTLRSDRCVKALAGVDCHTIGYRDPGISGGNFYNASNLPQNGTATLSDVTGSTITSPLGGATLVWKLGSDSKFSNMTAVAVSVSALASTTGGAAAASGSTAGSSSSSPASTASSASAGATTTTSTAASSTTAGASHLLGRCALVVGELAAVFVGMALL
jgi:hypothetical protein